MGEFPCRRFAEQNATRGSKLFSDHGIPCRDTVGQQFRLRSSADPGRFDDILEAIGYAVQWAARPIPHDFSLGRLGLGPCKLRGQRDKAQQLAVDRRYALQIRLGQLDRGQLALHDPARCVGNRDEVEFGIGHDHLPHGCEFGRHEHVRGLVGVEAGTPDAPEHPLQVAISIDQLVEMLCAGEHPVRVWRKYRALTREALAASAGVAPSYLTEIETRKKPGSFDALAKLAAALKISLDDIAAWTMQKG